MIRVARKRGVIHEKDEEKEEKGGTMDKGNKQHKDKHTRTQTSVCLPSRPPACVRVCACACREERLVRKLSITLPKQNADVKVQRLERAKDSRVIGARFEERGIVTLNAEDRLKPSLARGSLFLRTTTS